MGSYETILLAAGYSSRMGRLKALLPIGQTTVIRHLVKVMQPFSDRIIVVTGYRGDEIAAHLDGWNVTICENPDFDGGMFTSIKAGLRKLDPHVSAFFLLPVDYPLISQNLIQSLVLKFESSQPDVLYPSFQMRRGHPPLISAKCIPKILAYEGRGGMKGAMSPFNSGAKYFLTEDETCMIDMDTPEDYKRVLELAKKQGPI